MMFSHVLDDFLPDRVVGLFISGSQEVIATGDQIKKSLPLIQ